MMKRTTFSVVFFCKKNAVSTQLPQGIRPKNTITEQIENLKGQQETLPVDVRYYSFAGAVEGRADGL